MATGYTFRTARRDDLEALVEMLADDELGKTREAFESPLPKGYYDAFETIERDPNNDLIVCELDGEIVGMLQLTFIPGLTYIGRWRAQIEGVRVSTSSRGTGVGQQLLEWAIDRARNRNCHIVQLTTDKLRPDALRFYERLGFTASHEGMKLRLD